MSRNPTTSVSPERARDFTVMWQLHAPRVMAYALRHVDADAAEEVVAETFLVAWRRFADVPPRPLPWLLVVARNTIATLRRSGRRQAALQDRMRDLERLAEPVPAAEVSALRRADVLAAITALSSIEREALLLVAWDGLAPVDAARVAGCSTAAFYVRLMRARRRLGAHRDTANGSITPVPVSDLEAVRTTS